MELRAQGLLMIVGQFHDEVEASLQFACAPRDPLGQFLRGEITLRALRVLVEHLPVDSAAAIARRGHDWTTSDYLSWDASAQLRTLNTALANLFREKGQPSQEPVFIPTPAQEGSVEEAAEAEAEKQYLAQVRAEMDTTMRRIFVNPD